MTHAGGSPHGGSGGDDDGGLTVIVQKIPLPNWLQALAPVSDTLRRLGSFIQEKGSFRNAVLSIVAGWIVGGVLEIGGTVIHAVQLVFRPFLNALGIGKAAFTRAFTPAATALLDVLRAMNAAVAELTGTAGPAAPIITAVFVTASLYLLYRLTVSIAGEVPVLSTITDFLGIRP